jgi:hypothetical protein
MKRFVAVLLLAATAVHAQDRGTATCESWNADRPSSGQQPSPARTSDLSWVFDTIAAHTKEPERDYYAGQIDLTAGMDAGDVAAWMDSYCAAHARDNLEQAATALLGDLTTRWLKSHSTGGR